MKNIIKWIIEIPLLLIAIVLAFLFIVPWESRQITIAAEKGVQDQVEKPVLNIDSPKEIAYAEEIAYLFGWRRRIIKSKPLIETPPDIARWLKPMGFVVGKGNIKEYMFKDSRSGKVISVALYGRSRGWKLLEISAERFLFEYEGKKYSIIRNK
ncbi:MAG TPA: hypothetical protein ENI06_12175 [Spirochaetales bacterium]|nr:hypothetical protein [Spirochaetales bacterium]